MSGQNPPSQSKEANSALDPASVASFKAHLAQSDRIVAVIGAGLSAASGLATFRDANGIWSNHNLQLISSPAGWKRDPGLVWEFYSDRRRDALRANPNPAHFAIAELAKKKPGFVALNQNVDGLLQRAGMGEGDPKGQLKLLHGNLFDLRCAGDCGYVERGNFDDPLCPALSEQRQDGRENVLGARVPKGAKPPKLHALLFEGISAKNKKILGDQWVDKMPSASDAAPLRSVGEEASTTPTEAPVLKSGIEPKELPQCPGCKSHLLRPDVVWFGEVLPKDILEEVDILFEEDHIDLCLVIGTSSSVWPAAGYAELARKKGARIAVVNLNPDDAKSLRKDDWLFVGDASVVVPELLEMGDS